MGEGGVQGAFSVRSYLYLKVFDLWDCTVIGHFRLVLNKLRNLALSLTQV